MGCCRMWGGVLSAQPEGMLDGVCVGGTAFPKVCFPRWCRGTLGRGFLRHPWGWAGRGRPVGLRRKTVSVLRLPESPARAERAPLGG